MPGGAGPRGCGIGEPIGLAKEPRLKSCQCPCSGDHTLPGGAGPSGFGIGEPVGLAGEPWPTLW